MQRIEVEYINENHKLINKNKRGKYTVRPCDILTSSAKTWKGDSSQKKSIKFNNYLRRITPLINENHYVLFHGTSVDRCKNILRVGVQPIGGEKNSLDPKGFYMAVNPVIALNYAYVHANPVLIQFKINIREAEELRCGKDIRCSKNDMVFKNIKSCNALEIEKIYVFSEDDFNKFN